MRINKIYVSSFGKLRNFSLELKEGFNEINENNGWGKTTLATFIKCVFYGIDNGRKTLKDSDRKKYKPWDFNEKFGGYVEFTWGEKEYKIERYFGDKESDDTVRLFDLKTGRESPKTENLGKRLFSIDEEGFSSSVYFLQKDLEGDVSAGLIEKFNSSYSKENDDFYNATDRIDKAIKEYKIRGDKGKIPSLKRKIFDINEELSVANKARETFKFMEFEVKTLKTECDALKSKIDVLTEKLENAATAETVRIKKERINASKKRLEELNDELKKREAFLNGYIPTEDEIESYYNCNKELDLINGKIAELKSALSALENIDYSPKNGDNNSKKTATISAAVLSVLFAAAGFISVFNIVYLGIIFFCLAATGAAASVFLSLKRSKNFTDNKVAVNDLINIKKTEIRDYEKVAAVYEEKLNGFFSKFNLNENSFSEKFSSLKLAVAEYKRTRSEILSEEKNYALYSSDSDVLKPEVKSDGNTEEIKKEIFDLREKYAKFTREYAEKKSSLKALDEKASTVADYENALAGAKEELEKAEEEFDILSKTKDFLSLANDSIIGKYRVPMEESFKKYLSLMDSANDYNGIIDVDLNLKIVDGEKTRDPLFYSKGYGNLFEICKRFAFIDVLFSGEKPFIILDDPFCNLDGEKVKAGLYLLNKLSDEYQIIYFICHDSRSI